MHTVKRQCNTTYNQYLSIDITTRCGEQRVVMVSLRHFAPTLHIILALWMIIFNQLRWVKNGFKENVVAHLFLYESETKIPLFLRRKSDSC